MCFNFPDQTRLPRNRAQTVRWHNGRREASLQIGAKAEFREGRMVANWQVCRSHGAGGGALSGPANGRWRHGERSRSAEAFRREIADLVAEARKAALALGEC